MQKYHFKSAFSVTINNKVDFCFSISVQTILNAAPAPPSAKDVCSDLLSLCDIFCVNEQEVKNTSSTLYYQ